MSQTVRYGLVGVWFGASFPVVATLVESYFTGVSPMESQLTQPLLWIIDTAPIFLGLTAAAIGSRQDQIANQINELHKFNRRLEKANEELLLAKQLKDQFLANVSHELRTPLNAIIGFARLTLRKTEGQISERQSENLRRIYGSGNALLALVNDILDIERLEAGVLVVREVSVDIEVVFAEVHAMVTPNADRKGITLAFSVQAHSANVQSDPVRLRQLVTNLVVNAVKYSDSGTVKVEAFTKGVHFVISVQDEGIGIPEELLPDIFDPFRQVDGSTTRAQGGVGLGLNLVKNLTELLGGSVNVVSEVGLGSTFTLIFPLRETPSSDVIVDSPKLDREAPPLVFVVDDDPDALTIAREELAHAGYEVKTFSNPHVALREAQHLQPDMMLLDMVMPGWNGWSTLRAMAKHKGLADIPVIVTSFLEPPDALHTGNLVAWISKPITEPKVRTLIPESVTRLEALVVEDDESTLDLILQHISSKEARVRVATNGREALEIIANTKLDLVVLDLMLPEIDGFQVLKHLQAMEKPPETIIFSAVDSVPTTFAQVIGKGERGAINHLTESVQNSVTKKLSTADTY